MQHWVDTQQLRHHYDWRGNQIAAHAWNELTLSISQPTTQYYRMQKGFEDCCIKLGEVATLISRTPLHVALLPAWGQGYPSILPKLVWKGYTLIPKASHNPIFIIAKLGCTLPHANTILPKLDSNPCVAVPCRYSVAYFDRIAVFKAPYRWTSIKGEGSCALHRLVSYSCIYEAHMSPTLKGSSAIQRFERSDAIEIRDGITFNFYTGLPHVQNPTYGTNCMNHANLGRAWMRWLRYTATSTPFNNTKACNQHYLDR